MRVLVVGGAGSGKSAVAERIACALAHERTYVATMRRDGREALARIARHRALRASKGFVTRECPDRLPAGERRPGVALVEDLGNLVANGLFAAGGSTRDPAEVERRILAQVDDCSWSFDHLVVVSNEVGAEGRSAFGGTRAWVQLVGTLNCKLATSFDAVAEVVAGQTVPLKGVLP